MHVPPPSEFSLHVCYIVIIQILQFGSLGALCQIVVFTDPYIGFKHIGKRIIQIPLNCGVW